MNLKSLKRIIQEGLFTDFDYSYCSYVVRFDEKVNPGHIEDYVKLTYNENIFNLDMDHNDFIREFMTSNFYKMIVNGENPYSIDKLDNNVNGVHDCHCETYKLFNFGCKCGGK